jgi:hypothetical protein
VLLLIWSHSVDGCLLGELKVVVFFNLLAHAALLEPWFSNVRETKFSSNIRKKRSE